MTGTEYLEKCQIVSEVRKDMFKMPMSDLIPDSCIFEIDKIEYYPVGYTITYKEGKPKYTAILREKNTHHERYISLEKICKQF